MPTNPSLPPSRARALLAYFLRHPRREETLEDVIRWRIRQDVADLGIDEVTQAIDWLEREHFIVRTQSEDGTTILRLNDARIDAARELLEKLTTGAVAEDPADHAPETSPRQDAPRPVLEKGLAWVDARLLCTLDAQRRLLGDQPSPPSHVLVEAMLVSRRWPDGAPSAPCDVAQAAEREFKEALAAADPDAEPLAALQRLPLECVEIQAVLLLLAPELDSIYQLVYSVLADSRTPTLGLICELLGRAPSPRQLLAIADGLCRWRLLEGYGALPHADTPLHLDPAIVVVLLDGSASLLDDPQIRPLVRREPWPGASWLRQPEDLVDADTLAERIGVAEPSEWTVLHGEDATVWRALVESAGQTSAACLLRILGHRLADTPDATDIAARLVRAARLHVMTPVITLGDGPAAEAPSAMTTLLAALTEEGCRGVVICGDLERVMGALPREPMCVRRRGRLDEASLTTAYAAAAADAGVALDENAARQLAHAFPLGLDTIDRAVRLTALEMGRCATVAQQVAALIDACRRLASPELPRFARRIRPVFTLDDIVLPADRRAQLHEIVAHVTHARQVLERWGFGAQLPYGRGVAALFTGPSGTGKTMAAQGIAQALRTDAFVVDLSRVMSKFVGESEKNIDVAFADAERAGAVLQIDEADALFAKRSDVKDSHDRYANFLVSFLLHRMETFEGVAILTTNFGRTVDSAFLRRLRFVVEFPRPDADAREAIWRRCLPRQAPIQEDVNLRFLARRFELSGGNIRSITLRAAFLAVADGTGRIEMRHLIAATRAELLKLGMSAAERELAEFEAAQVTGTRVA